MNAKQSAEHATENPELLRAAKEYLAELEAGRRPVRAAFAARFPDLGDELEPYLQTLDLFQAARPSAPPVARPAPSTIVPAEPLGDFQIVREIGRGGMGTVYEAVQLSLGRRVALKVLPFAAALDNRQLQRFKNEAQAAAQLHHTNIVPVYAVGCERGVHYYAMQLIEGQNLADLIQHLRPLDPAARPGEAVDAAAAVSTVAIASARSTQRTSRSTSFYATAARLAIQAAEALEHAHQLGVVHRDIKPANLMIDAVGTLWITDFGLAQFHTGAALTRTGDLVGTLRYMSPEQASGRGAAPDARTDVYSLGATLYELLTLQTMFDGDGHHSLLKQILNDEPRPLRAVDRSVPAELETIVLKSVSKSRAERYDTAQAFADDLRRFVDNRPILARRPTAAQRVRKWGRRHPSFVIAAVILLGVITVGSLVSAKLVHGAYTREQQRAEEAEAQFRLAQRAVNEMIDISDQELADAPHLEGLRKRLLMSALVFYQEFIDRRRDDPASQEELRETKVHVERLLADLALLQGAGLINLVRQPAVLDDLGLDGEQRDRVVELSRRMGAEGRKTFDNLGKLSEDARRQRLLDLVRAEDAGLNTVLTLPQIQRGRQIALQLRGIAAFRAPDIAATLKLTNEQRKRIREVESEISGGGPPDHRHGPPSPEDRKAYAAKQKAAMQRIVAALTPEQARAWRGMTGPPFEGTIVFRPDGPVGGSRGPGGPGKGFGGPPPLPR